MNVVITIVVFAAAAVWGLSAYSRLVRLRDRVKDAWRILEADQSSESARTVYNRSVKTYNDTLEGLPASIVGMIAGFKPARPF